MSDQTKYPDIKLDSFAGSMIALTADTPIGAKWVEAFYRRQKILTPEVSPDIAEITQKAEEEIYGIPELIFEVREALKSDTYSDLEKGVLRDLEKYELFTAATLMHVVTFREDGREETLQRMRETLGDNAALLNFESCIDPINDLLVQYTTQTVALNKLVKSEDKVPNSPKHRECWYVDVLSTGFEALKTAQRLMNLPILNATESTSIYTTANLQLALMYEVIGECFTKKGRAALTLDTLTGTVGLPLSTAIHITLAAAKFTQ